MNNEKRVFFIKNLTQFLKQLIGRYIRHDIAQIGGQLAYFSLLSVFPFLVYFNALLGSFNLSKDDVAGMFSQVVTPEILAFILSYVDSLPAASSVSLMSVSIIATLYSASRILRSMEAAVNRAYGIKKRRSYVRSVAYSMVFTICLGLAFLLIVVLVTAGRNMLEMLFSMLHISLQHIGTVIVIKWIVIIVLLYALLTVIYFILPSKKMKWRSTVPGSVFSAAGLALLSLGFGVYTKYLAVYSIVYGSLGAVFFVLIWTYFCGIILVLGAEINCMLEKKHRLYRADELVMEIKIDNEEI